MSRFFIFRPISTRFFRPAAPLCASLCMGLGLLGSAFGPFHTARADEFSTLPPNDPIALQLGVISPGPAPASLTRYEAALQTARAILDAQNRDTNLVSRAQWRSIAALCVALKGELLQLGVDVEATRALAAKNLKNGDAPTAPFAPRAKPFKTAPRDGAPRDSATAGFLSGPLVAGAVKPRSNALETSLGPRLRASSALSSVAVPGATQTDVLSAQTALSYDLGRYLTLRAASSRLDWSGVPASQLQNPVLGAPLFAGAQKASGSAGGLDFNLGGLKFSTEVERLRADTGALANRIGGGASLSTWQDRLSLNMSLSRLLPQDKTATPATAAQVGASLDVSPRLSLNLSYQGLFAPVPSSSASRVAGGFSLNF